MRSKKLYNNGKAEDGRCLIRIENNVYSCHSSCDLSPLETLRRDKSTYALVVDRKRDFGGCGNHALKLEMNVPLVVWLQEIDARKEDCSFCTSPATSFDLAPTCDDCSIPQGDDNA